MSNRDVLEEVDRGYRMPHSLLVDCPDNIYDLMVECWHKDADKRPTFDYLYNYLY